MAMNSNYDRFPKIRIEKDRKCYACEGWQDIGEELRRTLQKLNRDKIVVCVDCYHGVWETDVLNALKGQIAGNDGRFPADPPFVQYVKKLTGHKGIGVFRTQIIYYQKI